MPQAFVHETETAFQKAQIALETTTTSPYANPTPGSGAAAATIALGSVTITPSIKRSSENFTPSGFLAPTVHTVGEESTELSFDGIATFSDIGYFCKDIVSDAQVNPITAGMVLTVEAGGLKVPGCIVTDWSLKGDKKSVKLSGKMIGKKGAVAAPTGALTPAAQIHLPAAGVVVTIDGVAQAKVFSWDLSVVGLWEGATFIGSSQFFNVLQKAFKGTFKFKQEFDSQAQTVMGIGATVTCGVVITAGARSVTLAFDAIVGEPGSLSDEVGIYSIENNLTIMNKATKCVAVTINNTP